MPTSFGALPGALNTSFTPFSVNNLKTAILPLDIITTISLQCVGGAKLMVDAGDGRSRA